MDFLEANKDAIEKAIYFRMADLLSLDVEIVFYDTTSLHFEVDEEDRGFGEADEVHGSLAGRKTYRAPRKRGHAKNGRSSNCQSRVINAVAFYKFGFPILTIPMLATSLLLVLEATPDRPGTDRAAKKGGTEAPFGTR
jgi:hypothetical protein